MKDFQGNELNVGDKVVYTSGQYLNLRNGIIKKIGKTTVTLDNGNDYKWINNEDKILTPGQQIIKLA